MELSIRTLNRRELPGFRPYLLPETAALLEREDPGLLALGAVTGRNSCGAAAACVTEDGAELTGLFVDEAARRRGVGKALLDALLEQMDARGAARVSADYVLEGEQLLAMDILLVSRGFFLPQTRSKVFAVQSADFRREKLLRRAFSPRYRTPAGICGLEEVPAAALEAMEQAEQVPEFLRWSRRRERTDPGLSAALVREGRVLAYQLAEEGVGGFTLLSAVSGREAPPTAFLLLLWEVLSRCRYRRGGDYTFYFSALDPRTERLALRLMGERYAAYEEHTTFRLLPAERGLLSSKSEISRKEES